VVQHDGKSHTFQAPKRVARRRPTRGLPPFVGPGRGRRAGPGRVAAAIVPASN